MADIEWLKSEVTALQGPKSILSISLAPHCDASSFLFNNDLDSVRWAAGGHEGPWAVAKPLDVKVQEFTPIPGAEDKHIFDLDTSEDGFPVQVTPQCYAIPRDCLPTLQALEDWALDTARNHPRAFVGGIRGSFLSLARRYCECKRILPLVSFNAPQLPITSYS